MTTDELNKARLVGLVILIVPPLFWAGNFVVGRAARADVPPMMLAFARHFVAFGFLLPFGWAIPATVLGNTLAASQNIVRRPGSIQPVYLHRPALDYRFQRPVAQLNHSRADHAVQRSFLSASIKPMANDRPFAVMYRGNGHHSSW